MKLGEVILKVEKFYLENHPTDLELESFIAKNIIKKDKKNLNEINLLEKEFKNKDLSEKYKLLLDKYLNLCYEQECALILAAFHSKRLDDIGGKVETVLLQISRQSKTITQQMDLIKTLQKNNDEKLK